MYKLNEKIRELTPYDPIKGDYKIRLDANESFLKIPEHIKTKIDNKLSDISYNRYPDPLATEISETFAKLFSLETKNIVAGNGSDELIALLFTGFVMKGDKFATFENDFSMYRFYGSLSECEGILIPKNEDFTIDVDKSIEMCKNNNVKLLIFSNPCNPTSLGLTKEKVLNIVSSLPETLVIADEAYMDFWNESIISEIENYSNLLLLKTCSKAFGMAALRVGFAIGNETLIKAIKAIKSPYNLNSYSQAMATVVLEHKEEIDSALDCILKSKEEMQIALKSLEQEDFVVLDSVTNFIVIKTSRAEEIFKYLLQNSIAVRCFKTFLRITAGTKEENAETIKCIKNFLDK
ncbi:MAG: histidinol-phosphate transaminase [Clostridia bacterium]